MGLMCGNIILACPGIFVIPAVVHWGLPLLQDFANTFFGSRLQNNGHSLLLRNGLTAKLRGSLCWYGSASHTYAP